MSKSFGIELEVSGTTVRCSSITPAIKRSWLAIKHKFEINCGNDHCGYEYRTPIMPSTPESISKIQKFFELMEKEVENNNLPKTRHLFHRNTGLHVHVDITELDIAARNNMFKIICLFEPNIYLCQPASRTNNSWCGSIRKILKRSTRTLSEINTRDFSSFKGRSNILSRNWDDSGACLSDKYTTVEFRYGKATFCPEDVVNWVLLLLIIVENAKHMQKDFQVPFTTKDNIRITAENQNAFAKFIRNADSSMFWLKRRRKAVARWVLKKIAERKALDKMMR